MKLSSAYYYYVVILIFLMIYKELWIHPGSMSLEPQTPFEKQQFQRNKDKLGNK